eukprot:CAMPEP_0172812186 /NCGR_PEP_ID=MMETSP1075-20121228/9885_1 /TAXON_ID=2916 /ORGANISM="Ceratium fusus, Strain PA161109" /LENGTH=98 /DNA_ID=CAMNT_0013651711 /DNA_START=98 /DNA_END=395 /DNA_ORIENTATION=+
MPSNARDKIWFSVSCSSCDSDGAQESAACCLCKLLTRNASVMVPVNGCKQVSWLTRGLHNPGTSTEDWLSLALDVKGLTPTEEDGIATDEDKPPARPT